MSGKHNKKKRIEEQQQTAKQNRPTEEQSEFSPKVERVYKLILRVMSWTVGIAFVAILILPEFNKAFLDQIAKQLFRIGFFTLVIFILIEFVGDSVKKLLSKVIDG